MSTIIQYFSRIWAGIEEARMNKSEDSLSKYMFEFAQLRIPLDFGLARSTISRNIIGLTKPPRSLILISYIFRVWKSYDTFPLYLAGVISKAVFIGTQSMEWYDINLERVRQIIGGITRSGAAATEIVEFTPPSNIMKAISIDSPNLKSGYYFLNIHNYKVWCVVIRGQTPTIYISCNWARILAMEYPHIEKSSIPNIKLSSLYSDEFEYDSRLPGCGGLRLSRWEDALSYIKKAYRARPFDKKRLDRLVEKCKVKNMHCGEQFPQLIMDIPSYLRDVAVKDESVSASGDTDDEADISGESVIKAPSPRKRKREPEPEPETQRKRKREPEPEPARKMQKATDLQGELLDQIKNYGEMLREIMKKI